MQSGISFPDVSEVFAASITRVTMKEAAGTSETSVNSYQSKWRNNPEDSHLHTRCENVKSHRVSKMLDIKMPHHLKDITANTSSTAIKASNITFSNAVLHITRLTNYLVPFSSKKINESRNTYNGLPPILHSDYTLLSDHTQLLGDSC
jgi:hypothetical protein